MTSEEWDVHVSVLSGRTFRQQIEFDITREEAGAYVRWGKGYTLEKSSELRSPASTHAKLKIGDDCDVVATPEVVQVSSHR